MNTSTNNNMSGSINNSGNHKIHMLQFPKIKRLYPFHIDELLIPSTHHDLVSSSATTRHSEQRKQQTNTKTSAYERTVLRLRENMNNLSVTTNTTTTRYHNGSPTVADDIEMTDTDKENTEPTLVRCKDIRSFFLAKPQF